MTTTSTAGSHSFGARTTPGPARRTFVGRTPQARVSQAEASRVLARVRGMSATDALAALQFSAGTVCEPVARALQQALAEAELAFGLGGDGLVLSGAEVGAGDVVTRVRRQAHGKADWITTQTTAVRVELSTIPHEARSDRP